MYLLIICLSLFIVASLVFTCKKKQRDAVSNIPGPYCVPFLGPVQLLYDIDPYNFFKNCLQMKSTYGDIIKITYLNRIAVFMNDSELVEQVLNNPNHITKHHLYGILQQCLGTGLLMSDGPKWHTRRRIIAPTFHFKILEQFIEIFNQRSEDLIHRLSERVDEGLAFDVSPYICTTTLEIVTETAMGTKLATQSETNRKYISAAREYQNLIAWRFMRAHLSTELMFTLLHPFKNMRAKKLIGIMHEFTRKVIEERRKLSLSNRDFKCDQDNDGIGAKKKLAFLDVLLEASVNGKSLSDEDIREEVDTFMSAGHETTTTALSSILHLVSRDPRVQQKLVEEFHNVYGSDNSKPFSLMTLNNLKYMECVIKESMRLYPPVPIIGRQLMEDFEYTHSRLGNGIFPAGTELLLNLYLMFRNEKYFENPLEFRPERHEGIDAKNTFAFVPFCAGPRNCIGQKFAMYEMKVMLAKIIRSYELLPLGEAIEPIMSISLRSNTGYQLGIQQRTINI